MRLKLLVALVSALAVYAGSMAAFGPRHDAAAGVCDLWVGQVWPAYPGTQSDGVVGACSFDWRGVAQVQAYEGKRWHIIGTHPLTGGRAGVIYQSHLFHDPEYHGCGAWRVLVLAHGAGETLRIAGPTTSFCARETP